MRLQKYILEYKFFIVGFFLIGMSIYLVNSRQLDYQCQTEYENFKKTQAGFLIPYTPGKFVREGPLFEQFNRCKEELSPTSCREYLAKLNSFINQWSEVKPHCQEYALKKTPAVVGLFKKNIALLVRIAWYSDANKFSTKIENGWLESSEIRSFCQLTKTIGTYEGVEVLKSLHGFALGVSESKVSTENKKSLLQNYSKLCKN